MFKILTTLLVAIFGAVLPAMAQVSPNAGVYDPRFLKIPSWSPPSSPYGPQYPGVIGWDANQRFLVIWDGAKWVSPPMGVGATGIVGGSFPDCVLDSESSIVQCRTKTLVRNTRLTVPNRINVQQVMASPPAVTVSTTGTIVSPRAFPTTGSTVTTGAGSFFTLLGAGGWIVQGNMFPNFNYIAPTSVNYGTAGGQIANEFHVALFDYDAELQFVLKGSGQNCRIKIDDQYVSLTPLTIPNSGATEFIYIPFGSVALRRVDLICGVTASGFGGVYGNQTAMIMPAPARGPSRVIVLGDSFTEGTGATGGASTQFVQAFADAMGWDDVWSSGVGSTGYVAAPGGKLNYGQRISTDVCPFFPDVVVFTGGINDGGTLYAAEFAAALSAYQAILACAPGVTLIVTDPFWRNSTTTIPPSQQVIRNAVKDAAAAAGAVFISVTEAVLPYQYTPITTTLQASAALNATTIQTLTPLAPEGNYKFADGTRVHIKTVAGGSFIATLDGTLAAAQSNGATVTQVGDAIWTGTGYAGATTGYGSSDLFVFTDDTHPSQAGHVAIGTNMAQQLIGALAPN